MFRLTSRLYSSSVYFHRCFASYPEHEVLGMPLLSPTMTAGTIVKWLKKEGDTLKAGDTVFEVETDKATMGYEVQDDVILAKILAPEGTSDVPIGAPIAVLVEEDDDVPAFANYSAGEADAAPAAAETPAATEAPSTPAAAATDYPEHEVLGMPLLSPTMSKGTIVKWLVKEGDLLSPGTSVFEVETDKATMNFEIQEEVYLAKILEPDGAADIDIGAPVAVLVDEEGSIASFKGYVVQQAGAPATPAAGTTAAAEPAAAAPVSNQGAASASPRASGERQFITPLARKLAEEKGLDYTTIKGTGPYGAVTKDDVLAASKAPAATKPAPAAAAPASTPTPAAPTPVATASYTDEPASGIRKVIAKRLLDSKLSIPHYYLSQDIQMDQLLTLRESLNKVSDTKISINDMIIKCASLALMKVPEANSSWLGDTIRMNHTVDMSVAVQTERGLITPIVKNSHTKRLGEIAADVKSLAEKARNNSLKPEEFQGGTFTISNLGMFGIKSFSAIINPPQSCILAVGATEKRVLVDEKSETGYRIGSIMNVTLSADHRSVDGAVGARYLAELKKYVENPYTLLL